MKYFRDFVLVRVESDFQDKLATIKGPEGSKIDLVLDTSYDPYKHVTISGTVVSCPVTFSPDIFLHDNYPGIPFPTPYKDENYCRQQVERIPDYQITKRRKVKNMAYKPALFTPNYTTLREKVRPELKEGDQIWFHYLTIHDENFVRKNEDGSKLYKVRYESVFCYKRKDTLRMLSGWVLVRQIFEPFKEVNVDGKKTEVDISASGIVKAVTKKPVPNQGILTHISHLMSDSGAFRERYSKVMFLEGSDFMNKIDGKDYMVMKEWDIVARVDDDGSIEPVNEYCLVKMKEKEEVSKNGLKIVRLDEKDSYLHEGKVIETGKMVPKSQIEVSNYVVFAKSKQRLELDGGLRLVHYKDMLYKKFHREYFDNLREVYFTLDRTFDKLKEIRPTYELPEDEKEYWKEECMKAIRILAKRTEEHNIGIRVADKDELRELDSLKNKAWRMYFFFEYKEEEHKLTESGHP